MVCFTPIIASLPLQPIRLRGPEQFTKKYQYFNDSYDTPVLLTKRARQLAVSRFPCLNAGQVTAGDLKLHLRCGPYLRCAESCMSFQLLSV